MKLKPINHNQESSAMHASAVRGYLSGFCSSMRTKLSPWMPSISWSRIKETFSSVGAAFKSTPPPLTDKQISVSQMDLLREELFPEVLEKVVASGGVLRQLAHNQFEFTEHNCPTRCFEGADAFSEYLESRVDEVSAWTIKVEGSDSVFYKYWDEFEGAFQNFSNKNALYHAISKEAGGAFKLINKANGITSYVRDRSGYFSFSFQEFVSEQLFLEVVRKDQQKRAVVLKCFAGFAAVASVGSLGNYLHSQRTESTVTNTQKALHNPDGQFGNPTASQTQLHSNFQLMSVSNNSSRLPTLTLTEEVPYVGNEWVVSDLFGPDYNGATLSVNSLPSGMAINSHPMRVLSSIPGYPSPNTASANAASVLIKNGNFVFLSYYTEGVLTLIDVSDASNPVVVNNMLATVTGMGVEDEFLYSIGPYFQVRDISNPLQIKLLGSIFMSNVIFQQQMYVSNKLCYITGIKFEVIDVSKPLKPNITDTLPISCYSIAPIGNNRVILASATATSSAIQVIDISNKFNLRIVGTLPSLPIDIYSIAVKGTTCYAAGFQNFYSIDISDVTRMKLLKSQVLFSNAWMMSMVNDLCYVLDLLSIQVISVQNKTAPTVVNSLVNGGRVFNRQFSIQVSNDYCYFTDDFAFRIATRGNTFSLIGTPQGGTRGNYTVVLSAQNQQGTIVNNTFDISVQPAITLQQPLASQLAVVGSDFNFFINADSFKQVKGSPIKYSAAPLPGWLNLNPVSGAFAGTPTGAGSFDIVVTATDNAGASASTTFSLRVVFGPTVQIAIQNQLVRVNTPFTFTIPQDAIVSKDSVALSFTATDNDLPLPSWLTFDPATLTLSGTPPTAGTVQLFLTAQDANGLTAQLNFQIIAVIPSAPVLLNPISNQIAQVGELFRFFVPSNAFADPYGGAITYTATLVGGDPLPNWLSFVNGTFSGTPGMTDTDSFASRILPISLVAKSDTGSSSYTFNISVSGQSAAELTVKVLSPILSFLGAVFALYKKRAWILNRWNKKKYQKLTETAVIGEGFQRKLSVAPEEVGHIKVLFRGKQLGVDGELPKGFEYNRFSNRIESQSVPKPRRLKELTFRIVGAANIILEEFNVKIVQKEADVDLEADTKASPTTSEGEVELV